MQSYKGLQNIVRINRYLVQIRSFDKSLGHAWTQHAWKPKGIHAGLTNIAIKHGRFQWSFFYIDMSVPFLYIFALREGQWKCKKTNWTHPCRNYSASSKCRWCLHLVLCWLSRWIAFKLLGIPHFIGKITLTLLFHGPLAEYVTCWLYILGLF